MEELGGDLTEFGKKKRNTDDDSPPPLYVAENNKMRAYEHLR